jgi:phosphatidylserine decarboxylase
MIITRYGTDVAIPILVGSLLVVALGLFIANLPLKVLFIVLGAFAFCFTLYFFRDPDRVTPAVDGGVISPADGRIVVVGEVDEPEYLKTRVRQISIFMSPLNVHVNRYPVTGTVGFHRYIPGNFTMAFEDKSSDVNERTLIGVENDRGKILFKQIAGFVARRIVCPVRVGDAAVAGARFGMIKFGSRVDVFVPLDAEVRVAMGEHVTAGETVLAVLK